LHRGRRPYMTHQRHWLCTAAMVLTTRFEPYQSTRLSLTMAESDLSCRCIIGYGFSSSPYSRRPSWQSPGATYDEFTAASKKLNLI
jgi:hypothetical protein